VTQKLSTKALAVKILKVLDELIDLNQTAYISGRSVTDSLLSILFMKDHCIVEGIDAVLISLDARKEFDSVSHRYTETILKKVWLWSRIHQLFQNFVKQNLCYNTYQWSPW
jgi:hypothetical protein